MVDAAVVEDKNATWPRIRVCKRYLVRVSKQPGYQPDRKNPQLLPKESKESVLMLLHLR
jgi:hypothetical protein